MQLLLPPTVHSPMSLHSSVCSVSVVTRACSLPKVRLLGPTKEQTTTLCPPVNLRPPLPAARPGEHLLHPLLLLPHPRHALHHPGAGGGEAEHVEGDVEGEVSLVGAGKGCHRVWPSVQTDWAELHPKATFTLTNAFHLLSIHIAHSQEIPIQG